MKETCDYLLKEPATPYNAHFDSKTGRLSKNHGFFWDDNL
jgi:hypothetical protein